MTAPDDAVRRAQTAAQDANRELESLTYAVAHDLRAPLRNLEGFARALTEDCGEQLNDDGKRYLQYIRESSDKLTRMIDSLLSLSRLGRSELSLSKIDLSSAAHSILASLQATAPERRAEISIADDVEATGDLGLLTAALEQLLGNAWKFTRKRQPARIEFGALHDQPSPVFFVRDNGAGFDERYGSKLFNLFQRLHSPEEFEGIGAGLAIVQRIVKRHGGRAWAEGTPDQGATFYFTLG